MRSPVRSERDAFRLAIAISVVFIISVVLGIELSLWWGVGFFLLMVLIAAGVLFFTKDPRKISPLQEAALEAPPTDKPSIWRILLIANESLAGHNLRDEITKRAVFRPELMIVAPVLLSHTHFVTTDVDAEISDAKKRLRETLDWAKAEKLQAVGHVGDAVKPMLAVEDELRNFGPNEIIVVSHPDEQANWTEVGMYDQLVRELNVPITQIIVDKNKSEVEIIPMQLSQLSHSGSSPRNQLQNLDPAQETRAGNRKVLVIANKTATNEELLTTVRERAKRQPCSFTLLIPTPVHGLHRVIDPEDQSTAAAGKALKTALPLLEDAAGAKVSYIVGDPVPMHAIQDAINMYGFDEIIISTLPAHLSRWIKLDLPSKLSGLGLPVTTVVAHEREQFAA